MTATNHVVTGALIATFIHNPWLAIPIAFASHFALDAIPHFSYPNLANKEAQFLVMLAADGAVAASILVTIFFLQPPAVWLLLTCGVAAASPDLMWFYYLMFKKVRDTEKLPAFARFHSRIQKEAPKYIIIELAWLLMAGGLLVTRLY